MRHILTALFTLLLAASLAAQPTDGLVGYWSFDDGTAVDNSGNGHDGDAVDVFPAPGQCGGAMEFDGAPYSHIILPSLSFPTFLNTGSISLWFNVDQMSGDNPLITYSSYTGQRDICWLNVKSTGEITYATKFNYGSDAGGHWTAAGTVQPETWYHLVVTADGINTIKFYVNGSLVPTTPINGNDTQEEFFDKGDTWAFGMVFNPNHVPGEKFLDGLMDEVRMYDRSLNAEEVWELYANCPSTLVALDIKPGSCPNPINVRGKENTHGAKVVVEPEESELNHPDAGLYGNNGPVFPVAILGTEVFDVALIDPVTIVLEGIPAMRWSYTDVATPVDPEAGECYCNDLGDDGFTDLAVKFDRTMLIETLGEVYDGDEIEFTISGYLYDGSAFQGTDCVVIRGDHVPSADDSDAPKIETSLPVHFALLQNYPNPFNPTTEIGFALPTASDVRLDVFNTLGQTVATLVDGPLEAGEHTLLWDASNMASGVYFYRLTTGAFAETKKMVLLK